VEKPYQIRFCTPGHRNKLVLFRLTVVCPSSQDSPGEKTLSDPLLHFRPHKQASAAPAARQVPPHHTFSGERKQAVCAAHRLKACSFRFEVFRLLAV